MPDLYLSVTGKYFKAIRAGIKPLEFREMTDYWKKRLEGREYDNIIIAHGYPKKDDHTRRITLPWRGYDTVELYHPHFDQKIQRVYAIYLQDPKSGVFYKGQRWENPEGLIAEITDIRGGNIIYKTDDDIGFHSLAGFKEWNRIGALTLREEL